MKLVLVTLLAVTACATGSGAGGDDAPIDAADAPDAPGGGAGDAAIDADTSSCVGSPCDLVPQCGCPSNQACDVDFTDLDGTACRGVTTPGTEASTCAAAEACAAGYVCVGGGGGSACKPYCASAADCDAPRGACAIQLIDEQDQPIAGAIVCSSNCDPVAAANPSCPSGWSCDLFTANATDIVDCRPAGAATQGQACSATVACAANHTCVNDGTGDVCGRICSRPAGTECSAAPGTTCLGFTDPFTVGGQEYGVCL